MTTRSSRLAALAAASVAIFLVYLAAFRPWLRTWGASEEEVEAVYPGDSLWPDAQRVETRAITINAPSEKVWPWVAQLGQGRGGFYTYEFLENLALADIKNANRLLGLADPKPGDKLWMAVPTRFEGHYAEVAQVEKGRYLVTKTHEGSDVATAGTWAFVLTPTSEGTTRLIVRERSGTRAHAAPVSTQLAALGFLEPADFVMERGLLLGLKARAEGTPVSEGANTSEALTWLIEAGFALFAAIGVLLGRSLKFFVVYFAAASCLLLLPLAHPPLFVSMSALICLGGTALWAVVPARAWARLVPAHSH